MELERKIKEFEEKHGAETLAGLVFKSLRKAVKKNLDMIEVLESEMDSHDELVEA